MSTATAKVAPTLDADESAALAAGGIERGDPFVLVRFGDGDLYTMNAADDKELADMLQATLGDRPGRPPLALSCGEMMSMEVRDALRTAWAAITDPAGEHKLLLGDPRTSPFGPELYPYWEHLTSHIERSYIPIHHETFWLSDRPQHDLLRFCQAVRYSAERKVLIGRAELAPAAALVEADFIQVQPHNSLQDALVAVCCASDYSVVLVAAGRGGKAIIHGLLDPHRTVVDIGSLFDPIYVGNTRPRGGAASDAQAEAFFSELADEPVTVAANRPGRAYG